MAESSTVAGRAVQRIDLERMASEAFDLLTEDGTNPEYDRALFDLLARCFPRFDVPTDDRATEMFLSMHCPACDGPRAADRLNQCSECAPLFEAQTHCDG